MSSVVNLEQEGYELDELLKWFCNSDSWKKLYYGKKVTTNEPVSSEKTGRNDPCPCNSGKKFKKCCGRK